MKWLSDFEKYIADENCWLHLCVKLRSAGACECNHRQRRLLSSKGVTERLATAILILYTGVALDGRQKLVRRSRQSDNEDRRFHRLNVFYDRCDRTFSWHCGFDPCSVESVFGSSISQQVLPQSFEEVLPEGCMRAEEDPVGRGFRMLLIFDLSELERAYVVGNLKQVEFFGVCVSVHDRIFEKRFCKHFPDDRGYFGLSVVVVDLDGVKGLEVGEVAVCDLLDLPLRPFREFVDLFPQFALFVRDAPVGERQTHCKHTECGKHSGSGLFAEAPVVVVAVDQRVYMHGYVIKGAVTQAEFVSFDVLADVGILLVEDEGEEVVRRHFAQVAGLVDEDGELRHAESTSYKTNAGGEPPALGGRPFQEDHRLYTIFREACPIIRYTEQQFYISSSNRRTFSSNNHLRSHFRRVPLAARLFEVAA